MAHLKHPEQGTEIEVEDDAAARYVAEGWEVSGDVVPNDKPRARRSSARKGADA